MYVFFWNVMMYIASSNRDGYAVLLFCDEMYYMDIYNHCNSLSIQEYVSEIFCVVFLDLL